MRMKVLSALSACLLSGGSLAALAEAPSLRVPYQFTSARPASLGGAFTAVADDQNALFYNPAGLAYLDSTFAALLDSEARVSVGSGGLSSVLDDFSKGGKILGELIESKNDISKALDKVVELGDLASGRTVFSGAKLQGYLVKKNWGFALTPSFDAGVGIHSKVLPETLDLGFVVDTDLRFGYAHSLLDRKLSLGIAPYYRLRAQGGQANLSLADALSSSLIDDQISVGQGWGADLGLMIRPVETMQPTFGLAIINVGDTKFYDAPQSLKRESSNKKPDPLKQVVNAGFSITPVEGSAFVRLSGELREINRPTPAEYKPAFGVETGFRSAFIRTLAGLGWGNGGWTAGVELRTFVKFRFATYIEPNLFFDRVNNQRVWVLSAGL
ncbi:MAG: hypothetical protein FJY29_01970 [Betaproteobacteria bacterium]|nr:hypothetical protein [Betaproteobacteria bacterium]